MRPFSCGSQDADWTDSNCTQCRDEQTCPHVEALTIAYCTNGEISEEDALAIGALAWPGRYGWPCPAYRNADGEPWNIADWQRKNGLLSQKEGCK